MLTISREQMRVLAEYDLEKRALPALCAYLREHHSAYVASLSEVSLHDRVRTSVATAESFGLTTRNDIYGFVALDLTVAPGFGRDHTVRLALEHSADQHTDRMLDLMKMLPSDVWGELCRHDITSPAQASVDAEVRMR